MYGDNEKESKVHRGLVEIFRNKLKTKFNYPIILDSDKETGDDDDFELNWPDWMAKKCREADVIIAICSKNYKDCLDSNEDCLSNGGVIWEGKHIKQYLHNTNHKLSLETIAFTKEDSKEVPTTLGIGGQAYIVDVKNLENCTGMDNLISRINKRVPKEDNNIPNSKVSKPNKHYIKNCDEIGSHLLL
jgi:hypothetical protein